jgi:gamma-butyrobetaine dioxygenase
VPSPAVAVIEELFVSAPGQAYLGEAVSMAAHQLQSAALARAGGASDELVAAALLHDVGHLLDGATDQDHGEHGARWLSQWFAKDVTEPVRLHVAAKRYLVTTEPGYRARLSPASIETLTHQGGPMDDATAIAFRNDPHGHDAIALRRWDDQAKDPAAAAPPLDSYYELLEMLARPR